MYLVYTDIDQIIARVLRRDHQISYQYQSIKRRTSITITTKKTNNLTRFDNLPTFSRQKGEVLIQSTRL